MSEKLDRSLSSNSNEPKKENTEAKYLSEEDKTHLSNVFIELLVKKGLNWQKEVVEPLKGLIPESGLEPTKNLDIFYGALFSLIEDDRFPAKEKEEINLIRERRNFYPTFSSGMSDDMMYTMATNNVLNILEKILTKENYRVILTNKDKIFIPMAVYDKHKKGIFEE